MTVRVQIFAVHALFLLLIKKCDIKNIGILVESRLMEIAMLGVGEKVDVLKESLEAISAATNDEGVLKMNLAQQHNKRYSPMNIEYPTPYADVRLEENDKSGHGLDCDLTFWAVQFKTLLGRTE